MKYFSLFFLFALFLVGSIQANTFMTFKYGLTDLTDSFKLQKHSFGMDISVDNGRNLKPKFDFTYVMVDEEQGVDYLLQGSANVLYEGSGIYYNRVIPYGYLGFGYEYVSGEREGFESAPYVQFGAGLEFPILGVENDDFKVVTEARWMQMITSSPSQDSEAALFIGFRFSTSGIGYSMHNSYRKQMEEDDYVELEAEAPELKLYRPKFRVFSDRDGDGVRDEDDRCPHTPPGKRVDRYGCLIHTKDVVPKIAKRVFPNRAVKFPRLPVPYNKRTILEVQFEPNSATLTPDSRQKVADFVEDLKRQRYNLITIEGYTDNSGDNTKNKYLSLKRAKSVKELMVSYGIPAEKIITIGKGSLNPIADNDTPEGRAKNRRIEVIVE